MKVTSWISAPLTSTTDLKDTAHSRVLNWFCFIVRTRKYQHQSRIYINKYSEKDLNMRQLRVQFSNCFFGLFFIIIAKIAVKICLHSQIFFFFT